MTVRAILTDLGGVLVYFNRRHAAEHLVRGVLAGRSVEEFDQILNGPEGMELLQRFELGEIQDEDYARELEKRLGAPLPRDAFWRAHEDVFTGNRASVQILHRVRKFHGARLVVVTNTDSHRLPQMLAVSGLKPDAVAASFRERVAKPDERMFCRALELACAGPAECLFVDDIETYVAAARALGIRGHHFTSNQCLTEELRTLGLLSPS